MLRRPPTGIKTILSIRCPARENPVGVERPPVADSLQISLRTGVEYSCHLRGAVIVENDQYAILAAKTEYREAYNNSDLDRLLSVFASEFTDCSDGEPSFYGEESVRALRQRTEELFRCFRVEMVPIVIDVLIKDDFAYDWGWHKVRLIAKDTGSIADTKYRYFETWKKENGAWKIDYIITNKELPPRLLPEESGGSPSTMTAGARTILSSRGSAPTPPSGDH
ncbi:MAG TPA: nuclear transport factor 2 family protein [Acidobacteriaceae bacterium]